jgi:hypothetical protein
MIRQFEKPVETDEPVADTNGMVETVSAQDVVQGSVMNALQFVISPHADVKPGVYRHFKGRRYEVVGVARVVDSSDYVVVYRPLYGDRQLVIRTWADFVATVNQNDEKVPRFRYVKPAPRRIESLTRLLRRLRRLWTLGKRRSRRVYPV